MANNHDHELLDVWHLSAVVSEVAGLEGVPELLVDVTGLGRPGVHMRVHAEVALIWGQRLLNEANRAMEFARENRKEETCLD